MKKNLLTIDGSYVAHRSVYAMSKRLNREITLDTQEEMILFEEQYVNDIKNITEIFKEKININSVLVFVDKNSWRHYVEPFKPYYVTEKILEIKPIPLGYKENRKDAKEKSGLDYNNLKACLDNAVEELNKESGITAISLDGWEADDGLFLTAYEMTEDYNIFMFANDGDLVQCVIKPNVFYYKRTKNNLLIVNQKLKRPHNPLEMMQYKSRNEVVLLNKVSELEGVSRSFENKLIEIAEPLYFAFTKAVVGDTKDNIFPILGWYSDKGRRGRVLPKNVDAAFESIQNTLDFDFEADLDFDYHNNELLAKHIINDVVKTDKVQNISHITKMFLLNLIMDTKQQGIAKNIFNHLKHNINIMVLSVGSMKLLNQFKTIVKPAITENTKDVLNFGIVKYTNNKQDILESSIPTPTTELENKNDADVVNSILDSL